MLNSGAEAERHRESLSRLTVMFPVRRVSSSTLRPYVNRVRWAGTYGPLYNKDKFKILVLGGGSSVPRPHDPNMLTE